MKTTGLALLEVTKKIKAPDFVGDSIHCVVPAESSRETSKGGRGIVNINNDIINQKNETVISYRAVRMMAGKPKKAHI